MSTPALGQQQAYDFAVVGGGIVGVATALTLLRRRPGASLVLLEKEPALGVHQTGHNSGVIHAGVYYKPKSLKAQLCFAGARRTREFCDEQGIAYRDTGKLIVATNDDEVARMETLFERATANGLSLERLDAAELRRREPHVTGIAALFSPTSGIVDYAEVCRAMARLVTEAGGEICTGVAVSDLTESLSEVRIDVEGADVAAGSETDRVYAKQVVVCGGIQADRLARMAGLDVDFQMVPFRGEYYRLPESKHDIVNTLIYPVPDPSMPFLGVHLTLMMDGGVTVGPNAVLGWSREGYRKGSVTVSDTADFLRYGGFWRLVRPMWRTGLVEQRNSLYKPGYLEQVRKYCPSVQLSDLHPEPAGIRAQAVRSDGTMVDDFLVHASDRMLHVCNAPSPAATSALPISEMIVDQLLSDRA